MQFMNRMLLLVAALAMPCGGAFAQSFADVGSQPPITILINSSPWYAGFEKAVELYEKQTGNKVKLDVKSGTATITGVGRVVLDAPVVQEGSGTAVHPSVLGDQLLTYLAQLVTAFNTHVHPGEMALGFMPVTPAPPVGPMTPPTPALVSKKVFLE